MSRYRRANTAGATYFFTVVTYRRQPILCDAPVRTALRDAIVAVREQRTCAETNVVTNDKPLWLMMTHRVPNSWGMKYNRVEGVSNEQVM